MATKGTTNKPAATLPIRALEHGRSAYGAKYIREGFGRAPDDDLAWALGYPHYIELVESSGDSDKDLVAQCEQETTVRERAASVAARFARAIPMFAFDSNGKPQLTSNGKQISPSGQMTNDEARNIILEFAKDEHGAMLGAQLAPMLEAIVGPELVATAIVDGIETLDLDAPRAGGAEALLMHLPFLLLRVPTAKAEALLARLEKLIPPPGTEVYVPPFLVEIAVRGAAAKLRELNNPYQVELVNDEAFVATFAKQFYSNLDSTTPLFPRFLFTGGDAVLDIYGKVWPKIKRMDTLVATAEGLACMKSPKADGLLRQLATASKAKAKIAPIVKRLD